MTLTLKKHRSFSGVPGPVLVVVMDGVGIGRRDAGDAVWLARTPTLDWLGDRAISTTLRAHGRAVGLPSDKDMGNSEVGHNALGAGRVFDQGAKRVHLAIQSEELFAGDEWNALTARVRERESVMHFIGLLSDGNVHSHIDHLFAMIRRCAKEKVQRVRVHALLDGRDVPETSALTYVDALEELLTSMREAGLDYRVASGGGRMTTTMDRYEADWSIVERGYHAHVHGRARHEFPSLRDAVVALRADGTTDQFLPEFVITENGAPVGPIEDGASVIFFNFRGDRAIEISRALGDDEFTHFDRDAPHRAGTGRGSAPDIRYAGMMEYDGDEHIPARYLVQPPDIDETLGQYLAENGVSQFACSETQKFGHVTYFWNGNKSGAFDAKTETYREIKSDLLPFQQRPWMKAGEITDATIAALTSGDFRHLRINFANGDMVGHTGDRDAAVLAVQTVDLCLARLLPIIEKLDGAMIVTADHGNADQMFEIDKKTGAFQVKESGHRRKKTSHTLNPVPLHVFAPGARLTLADQERRGLSQVAATVTHLLGYEPPADFHASLLA